MMNNAAMQEMFTTYGKRICAISLNNNKLLLIDYKGSKTAKFEDISFVTVGGVDMMAIKRTDISSGKDVHYTNYIVTEFVESVMIMDEDSEQYRIDPLIIK